MQVRNGNVASFFLREITQCDDATTKDSEIQAGASLGFREELCVQRVATGGSPQADCSEHKRRHNRVSEKMKIRLLNRDRYGEALTHTIDAA
jgi:hypothetical protein